MTVFRKINIGCGASPTPGYDNYDNSLTVWVANRPLLARIAILGFGECRRSFLRIARENNIRWANATKRIPLPGGTVEVLYSCHTLEHLDQREVKLFLKEARRVLTSGGVLRVVVPDFAQQVAQYCKDRDADQFLMYSNLSQPNPRTFFERAKLFCVGMRHHLWAYDAMSMSRLLSSMGFLNVGVVPPGETTIKDPGHLNLNERAQWSLFVEAVNP